MGFSTIPAGALLYRDEKFIEGITVDAPYLISMKHSTLTGTRGSAAVAATYAVLSRLGREGFKEIVKKCMTTTDYLASRIEELGLELAIKPKMNVVGIRFPKPEKLVHELAKQNWFVSTGRYPPTVRIVVMPHVTRTVVDNFIPVFEKMCHSLGEL